MPDVLMGRVIQGARESKVVTGPVARACRPRLCENALMP